MVAFTNLSFLEAYYNIIFANRLSRSIDNFVDTAEATCRQ